MNIKVDNKTIEQFIMIRAIYELKYKNISQRSIASVTNFSIGKINKLLKECQKEKLLDEYVLTKKAKTLLNKHKVDCAIILASGLGTRLAPLSYETPKGLCTIFGERMLERQIKQLNEVGIKDIIIVVGYLKEKFEYLIDKYGVKLVYNKDFAIKNNLFSLSLVKKYFKNKNSYILASDHWFRENIFHKYEMFSWYGSKYFKGNTKEWGLKYNKYQIIKRVYKSGKDMYCMYGPSFFNKVFSKVFCGFLTYYEKQKGSDNYYWEDIFVNDIKKLPDIFINKFKNNIVYEFETLEEFRAFDSSYIDDTGNFGIKFVSKCFNVSEKNIVNIKPINAGMTNKSWMFSIKIKNKLESYICRSPGIGANNLINREQEKKSYELLKNYDITDEIIALDEKSGYKISKYYSKYRKINLSNINDLKLYANAYCNLHSKKIKTNYIFDFKKQIFFYEKLIKNKGSNIPFDDIDESKKNIKLLLQYINKFKRPNILIHVDSCVDNLLIIGRKVRIIDWEYAAGGDPLIDIAMFTIYSYKDYKFAYKLLDYYLNSSNKLAVEIMKYGMEKADLYTLLVAYMSISAYLWTLWSIYKGILGEDYGEYELKMYNIFKNNFRYLTNKNILL